MSIHYILLVLYVLTVSAQDLSFICKTPNNEVGVCVSIFSCPVVLKPLATLQPSALEFVQKSICGDRSKRNLLVCCGITELQNHNKENAEEQFEKNQHAVVDVKFQNTNLTINLTKLEEEKRVSLTFKKHNRDWHVLDLKITTGAGEEQQIKEKNKTEADQIDESTEKIGNEDIVFTSLSTNKIEIRESEKTTNPTVMTDKELPPPILLEPITDNFAEVVVNTEREFLAETTTQNVTNLFLSVFAPTESPTTANNHDKQLTISQGDEISKDHDKGAATVKIEYATEDINFPGFGVIDNAGDHEPFSPETNEIPTINFQIVTQNLPTTTEASSSQEEGLNISQEEGTTANKDLVTTTSESTVEEYDDNVNQFSGFMSLGRPGAPLPDESTKTSTLSTNNVESSSSTTFEYSSVSSTEENPEILINPDIENRVNITRNDIATESFSSFAETTKRPDEWITISLNNVNEDSSEENPPRDPLDLTNFLVGSTIGKDEIANVTDNIQLITELETENQTGVDEITEITVNETSVTDDYDDSNSTTDDTNRATTIEPELDQKTNVFPDIICDVDLRISDDCYNSQNVSNATQSSPPPPTTITTATTMDKEGVNLVEISTPSIINTSTDTSLFSNFGGVNDLMVTVNPPSENLDGVMTPNTMSVDGDDATLVQSETTTMSFKSNITLEDALDKVEEVTSDTPEIYKNTPRRRKIAEELLPTLSQCGVLRAEMDDYPWMVYLLYGNEQISDSENSLICTGVLINQRYILTNVYCAQEPTSVHVGLYTTNPSLTCGEDATRLAVPIKIDNILYRTFEEFARYDFALLRLDTNLRYSECIRPICLPLTRAVQKPATQNSLIFSGWKGEPGGLKNSFSHQIVNNQRCYNTGSFIDKITTKSTLICLLNHRSRDDFGTIYEEGGPLMYKLNDRWYVHGLITTVYFHIHDDSEMYADVDGIQITPEIIEWILDNIRA